MLRGPLVQVNLVYQITPSPALDVLHHPVLVIQYIQSWGGSDLVHETVVQIWVWLGYCIYCWSYLLVHKNWKNTHTCLWGDPPGPQGSYSTFTEKIPQLPSMVSTVCFLHTMILDCCMIAHFLVCLNYVVALGQFFLLSVSARLKKRNY